RQQGHPDALRAGDRPNVDGEEATVSDWSRYEECNKCNALGGQPCISLAPQHAGMAVAVSEAHIGRPKKSQNGSTPVNTQPTPVVQVVAPDPEPPDEELEPELVEEPE